MGNHETTTLKPQGPKRRNGNGRMLVLFFLPHGGVTASSLLIFLILYDVIAFACFFQAYSDYEIWASKREKKEWGAAAPQNLFLN